MKKVSVAIPAYNQAHFIEQALDSILAQDYPNLEVVVSDNASTDVTPAVMQPYLSDPRVHYFRNPTNLGMLRNFKKALYEYSTGELALHMDADDFLTDSHYISEAVEMMDRHGLIMVFGRTKSFYEKDQTFIEDKVNSDLPAVMDGNWLFLNYYKGYSLTSLTVVHDRKKAMEVGFYDYDIRSVDWENLLKLMINEKVGFINRFVGVWRRHDSGWTFKQTLNLDLQNIAYIDSPYRYALSIKAFTQETLVRWRRRMLKRYFVQIIVRALLMKDSMYVMGIIDYLKANEREVYYLIFLDPRFAALRLSILGSRSLTRFIFKHILKQESFFKDYAYVARSQPSGIEKGI